MADHDTRRAEVLADVEKFLGEAQKRQLDQEPGTAPLNLSPERGMSDELRDGILSAVSTAELRDQFGSPKALVFRCVLLMREARERNGFVSEPQLTNLIDLLRLHEMWIQREAWRPLMVEIRKPTELVRATSKRPPRLFDLRWWTGSRQ